MEPQLTEDELIAELLEKTSGEASELERVVGSGNAQVCDRFYPILRSPKLFIKQNCRVKNVKNLQKILVPKWPKRNAKEQESTNEMTNNDVILLRLLRIS